MRLCEHWYHLPFPFAGVQRAGHDSALAPILERILEGQKRGERTVLTLCNPGGGVGFTTVRGSAKKLGKKATCFVTAVQKCISELGELSSVPLVRQSHICPRRWADPKAPPQVVRFLEFLGRDKVSQFDTTRNLLPMLNQLEHHFDRQQFGLYPCLLEGQRAARFVLFDTSLRTAPLALRYESEVPECDVDWETDLIVSATTRNQKTYASADDASFTTYCKVLRSSGWFVKKKQEEGSRKITRKFSKALKFADLDGQEFVLPPAVGFTFLWAYYVSCCMKNGVHALKPPSVSDSPNRDTVGAFISDLPVAFEPIPEQVVDDDSLEE